MKKPTVRKLSLGTYRVTFTKGQSYVVSVPNLWLQFASERELRSIAIECASEQLPE